MIRDMIVKFKLSFCVSISVLTMSYILINFCRWLTNTKTSFSKDSQFLNPGVLKQNLSPRQFLLAKMDTAVFVHSNILNVVIRASFPGISGKKTPGRNREIS